MQLLPFVLQLTLMTLFQVLGYALLSFRSHPQYWQYWQNYLKKSWKERKGRQEPQIGSVATGDAHTILSRLRLCRYTVLPDILSFGC